MFVTQLTPDVIDPGWSPVTFYRIGTWVCVLFTQGELETEVRTSLWPGENVPRRTYLTKNTVCSFYDSVFDITACMPIAVQPSAWCCQYYQYPSTVGMSVWLPISDLWKRYNVTMLRNIQKHNNATHVKQCLTRCIQCYVERNGCTRVRYNSVFKWKFGEFTCSFLGTYLNAIFKR